ncbi:MAG: putative aminoglycoside phosphotransferase [Frankiales bacterium]|nr:putative aminoglycoside phosphotransferase [Frankiales bacterium]
MTAGTAEHDQRTDALERWLAPVLGAAAVRVPDLARASEGNSNETLLFTAEVEDAAGVRREDLVLRVQPHERPLFLRPDAVRESAVLRHVAASGRVPVPEVLGAEADAGVLGAPFFVMRRLNGRVLTDIPSCHAGGWLSELSPEQRARHWESGARALAGVAAVPVDGPRGLWPDAPRPPLPSLVAEVRAWFDATVQGRDVGVLDAAIAHLEQEQPDHRDAVLSWGDARPGNLLFAPDGEVAAVLDWEMAALGTPEVDLGWWLVTDEFYSTRLGTPPLPGVPSEQDFVARWEELSGRPPRELRWYKVLAALRFALVLVRSRDTNVARGRLGPDSRMHTHNPMAQVLAALLGLAEPELAPEFARLVAGYVADKGR